MSGYTDAEVEWLFWTEITRYPAQRRNGGQPHVPKREGTGLFDDVGNVEPLEQDTIRCSDKRRGRPKGLKRNGGRIVPKDPGYDRDA